MKTLVAAAISLSLVGCTSVPRPQSGVILSTKPAVERATFNQRFGKFVGRLVWVRSK